MGFFGVVFVIVLIVIVIATRWYTRSRGRNLSAVQSMMLVPLAFMLSAVLLALWKFIGGGL